MSDTGRILVITPARNEAANLGLVAEGMLAQHRPADRWIVVDDGSTDASPQVLRGLQERIPYLEVVSTPPAYTLDRGDRNAAGGPDRAFNFGVEHAGSLEDYDFVVKLDADIVLPEDYFSGMLARFAAEPRLGAAGGAVTERDGEEWKVIKTPADHPTAPARVYRRECYVGIGGMPPFMGADVITTYRAKMAGWTTRTFSDLPVRHLRVMGAADGIRRGRQRHGAYQYFVHYGPVWIIARSALVGLRFRPRILSGIWFLEGYARAALGRTPRLDDPAVRAFARREQQARLRAAITGRLRRVSRRLPGGTVMEGPA